MRPNIHATFRSIYLHSNKKLQYVFPNHVSIGFHSCQGPNQCGSLTRTDAFWNMDREISVQSHRFLIAQTEKIGILQVAAASEDDTSDQKIAIYPSTPSHTLNPTISTRRDPGFSSLLLLVPIFLGVFFFQSVLPKQFPCEYSCVSPCMLHG